MGRRKNNNNGPVINPLEDPLSPNFRPKFKKRRSNPPKKYSTVDPEGNARKKRRRADANGTNQIEITPAMAKIFHEMALKAVAEKKCLREQELKRAAERRQAFSGVGIINGEQMCYTSSSNSSSSDATDSEFSSSTDTEDGLSTPEMEGEEQKVPKTPLESPIEDEKTVVVLDLQFPLQEGYTERVIPDIVLILPEINLTPPAINLILPEINLIPPAQIPLKCVPGKYRKDWKRA